MGKLFGGMLLVAGCSIGAGMLGLPVLTAEAGFIPALSFFFLSWLFMVSTGLLVLEVNLSFSKEVSFVTMAGETLGWSGRIASWLLFAFLFYSLMVAYVSGTGALVADFLPLPPWLGSLFFVLLFGAMIYAGTQAVDLFNRWLMAGLVVAYLGIIFLGSRYVDSALLSHQNWSAVPFALPVMIISFGYHNLIPTLKNYMGGDRRNLIWTIVAGSAIPLLVYLAWEWLMLGIVPPKNLLQGEMATQALRNVVGSPWVVILAQCFAFFAIVTSLLGVALSFVDFLADGLKTKNRALLCLLVLGPPLAFAVTFPGIFLTALNYAGGFGAVILFGILPALMVWRGRGNHQTVPILPGGKLSLSLIILFSLVVVVIQAYNH